MDQGKRTLVIGASPHAYRYSYLAVERLILKGHPVIALGHHAGRIGETEIFTEAGDWKKIDTVTLYINPAHQKEYESYLVNLKPNRVIFNPGTENAGLERRLETNGIETIRACTLVMLSTGQY